MQTGNYYGRPPMNTLEFDINRVAELGFSREEIDIVVFCVQNFGAVTVGKLANMRAPNFQIKYDNARRMKYLYDIAIGRVEIPKPRDIIAGRVDTESGMIELSKHFRRINITGRRVTTSDLALSKIREVPRFTLIGGIADETFKIYNSVNYRDTNKLEKMVYKVDSISNSRVLIDTTRRPVIKYRQPKKVDGVIEITEEKENGHIEIAVNREYTKLVNRYIIVATLNKAPEFHCGMIQMIAFDGTRVCVYAKNIGEKSTNEYYRGNQRIYNFGLTGKSIENNLRRAADELSANIGEVMRVHIEPTEEFSMTSKNDNEEENYEEIIRD